MTNRKRYLAAMAIIAAALISVLCCTTPHSDPPTITSLQAEPERILPSGSAQIVCAASADDGGELDYEWSPSGGQIEGTGATVTWKAPADEGWYNVGVTVTDDRGGEATEIVTVRVKANEPPVINDLTADPGWALPGASLQATCDAEDPDGHPLSYEWSASGGDISGTGSEATWTAPEEVGGYDITVIINDGYGGSDTTTLPVSVWTGQPPIIEALEVTKDRYGHCYLIEYSWGYKVGMEQQYDIDCIVADTGVELFYEWSCDGGELSEVSEDGSMIAWTAPSTSGEVIVTVIVSDIADNMVSESVTLEVVSCSPCTFGSCN